MTTPPPLHPDDIPAIESALHEVTVFAPASVANVAVGYDVLGFALRSPGDEVTARRVDAPGVQIAEIDMGPAEGTLPTDPSENTAGAAAGLLLTHLGADDVGVDLTIRKRMRTGTGLGSSAASAVASAVAVNELLGAPFSREELLPFVVHGERVADGAWHADNAAPSLFGGFVLVRSNADLDVVPLPVLDGLWAAVVHPHVRVLTRSARAVLAPTVPLADAVVQTGNIAGFVAALFRSDLDLLRRSLRDVLIEPQRAPLVPHFHDAQAAALDAGALGCSLSGSGPSVFALCEGEASARAVGDAMAGAFRAARLRTDVYVSPAGAEGAVVRSRTPSA